MDSIQPPHQKNKIDIWQYHTRRILLTPQRPPPFPGTSPTNFRPTTTTSWERGRVLSHRSRGLESPSQRINKLLFFLLCLKCRETRLPHQLGIRKVRQGVGREDDEEAREGDGRHCRDDRRRVGGKDPAVAVQQKDCRNEIKSNLKINTKKKRNFFLTNSWRAGRIRTINPRLLRGQQRGTTWGD